ncbi:MAG: hypothetical protein WC617_11335 [Rhodanobacter sp.]
MHHPDSPYSSSAHKSAVGVSGLRFQKVPWRALMRPSRFLHVVVCMLCVLHSEGKVMGTIYVVQGFHEVEGDVIADKPILHGMEQLARSRGQALAERCAGVLVYAQGADADRGEYSSPTILACYGRVPHPDRQRLDPVSQP